MNLSNINFDDNLFSKIYLDGISLTEFEERLDPEKEGILSKLFRRSITDEQLLDHYIKGMQERVKGNNLEYDLDINQRIKIGNQLTRICSGLTYKLQDQCRGKIEEARRLSCAHDWVYIFSEPVKKESKENKSNKS